jgi:hypothetical protein
LLREYLVDIIYIDWDRAATSFVRIKYSAVGLMVSGGDYGVGRCRTNSIQVVIYIRKK